MYPITSILTSGGQVTQNCGELKASISLLFRIRSGVNPETVTFAPQDPNVDPALCKFGIRKDAGRFLKFRQARCSNREFLDSSEFRESCTDILSLEIKRNVGDDDRTRLLVGKQGARVERMENGARRTLFGNEFSMIRA